MPGSPMAAARFFKVAAAFFLSIPIAAPAGAQQTPANGDHPAIERAPALSGGEAERLYRQLRAEMASRYRVAHLPEFDGYQDWQRYSGAPYLSKAHGNRYLNNYASRVEVDLAQPPAGTVVSAGTILAKDSFTVTEAGKVLPGSLFIMEKLAAGRSPATADWRYVAIHPDGSIEGDTTGDSPQGVAYCHQCHQTRSRHGYLFGLAGAE